MCEPRRCFVSFFILLWILVLSHCLEPVLDSFPREFDFRYTSYEELIEEAPIFNHEDLVGFTLLTVDEGNDQLLVGARNSIFRLSLDNLDLIEHAEFKSKEFSSCMDKGESEESCHNYIRVLLLHNYTKAADAAAKFDNAVFVCGTNAFSPICQWRPANNLSKIIETSIGVGVSPNDPGQNSTTIITTEGDIYGATHIGTGNRDPAIYRSKGSDSNELRTAQANSKWLNEPDFVSSYEIGDLVYFFFREVAVEYINCGKRMYSRVARLCKNDEGGMFDNTWTTFFKSRLNCSLPGEYPFYYDELQATFLLDDGSDKYIYAVFNTPINSIPGSAVCVYNILALDKSFAGPFKYQESPRSAWERHEQPENGQKPLTQCPEKRDHTKRSNDKPMTESKYQFMDEAVQPETTIPLVHADNERWTHVVVDNVRGKQGMYRVVFVATADGKIRKLTTLLSSSENTTCLVEEIKIVPNGDHKPVKEMRISTDEMAIYISTQHNVIKVPVHRCSRFKNSDVCINANDPYCGWDDSIGECTTAPSGQPEVHYWSQSMAGCPFIPHAVNGGWSDWSKWENCSQVGGDGTTGDCKCRSRSCDSPKPYYGGQPCNGASVEVTNCTAHGQWTDWTSWSACTQTCGSTATRSRHRYCSNPPPRFGGRPCVGTSFEDDYCQGHPPCPLPPVKGNWTSWAEWSECSANCNGGIQRRRRTCLEPQPPVESIPCVGNTQEWRMCNTQLCEMLNQMTPWTPWVATNHTKGGFFEERFRFMCMAKVPSQTMIQSKHIKTQARFCFDGGQCYGSDVALVSNIDGGWSEWNTWSTCTSDCDGGLRWRRRECNNPKPLGEGKDCHGHAMEGQECNAHPCQGVWSCWSAVSGCSVTCGRGMVIRYRECDSLPPGNKFIIPCEGNREETTDCDMGPCINVALSSSMSDSFMEKPRFSLAQMFLVGGLSFFLGGSASIALYCYVSSFRRAMREAKQNERKQKLERKMSEQRLSKRQSQASIRTVPHMSSHTRLDDGYTSGRSKFYDVDTVIRDSPNRMSMGVSHSTPSQMSLDNVFGGRSKVYDVENVMKDNPEQEEPYYSTIDKKCALKTFTIKDL